MYMMQDWVSASISSRLVANYAGVSHYIIPYSSKTESPHCHTDAQAYLDNGLYLLSGFMDLLDFSKFCNTTTEG